MESCLSDSVDKLTRITAEQYKEYLKIDTDQSFEAVDGSLEAVLTRLDELYAMLDMIREDNCKVVNEVLPLLQARIQSLNPVFQKIDQLELFVQMVKRNVAEFEKEVKSEQERYGAVASLKKALSSFSFLGFGKGSESVSQLMEGHYNPPSVFSTADYFKTTSAESQMPSLGNGAESEGSDCPQSFANVDL